ncbi:rhamnogalacturonan acetylesterase [Streptomyces sp. NPDC056883]|uniref:rhamnogalacturonan acetylesterase n=1 Tax=Streptomyces sp. NPDC056883 TaxID=3345959 RepID=UPI003680BE3C
MTSIYLAGGSTVCSRRRSTAPMAGWGQTLPLFLQGVEVVNCARDGASTKSFMEHGHLGWILENIRPEDLLVVSFGLSDTDERPGPHAEPFGAFQTNLRRYVNEARDRGAHPVLVTSHERRVFDRFGNMRRPLVMHPAAMREVAVELTVPLIDLNEWSTGWWRQLGPEGTKSLFVHLAPGEHPNYPRGAADDSRLRSHGALECSRFIASRLLVQGMLPAQFFRNLETGFDADQVVEFLDDAVFDQMTKTRVAGGMK